MEKKLQELIDSWKKEDLKRLRKSEKDASLHGLPNISSYWKGKAEQLLECISEAEELLKQQEGTNE